MTPSHAACIAALCLAFPAGAQGLEDIGTIDATFDGETIAQTAIRYSEGDEQVATAEFSAGFGSTNLSIYGGDVRRQLVIEVMFPGDAPGPASPQILASVAWFPNGMADHWSSEDAPTPPSVTFSRLEAAGDEGHATGAFAATLCATTMRGPPATAPDCRPITGRFDTRLFPRAD